MCWSAFGHLDKTPKINTFLKGGRVSLAHCFRGFSLQPLDVIACGEPGHHVVKAAHFVVPRKDTRVLIISFLQHFTF